MSGAPEEDAAAASEIAATMGFCVFGNQSFPNKKRRFDVYSDNAVVIDAAAVPSKNASCSNSPTAHAMSTSPSAAAHPDELALDEDNNEDQDASPSQPSPSAVAAAPGVACSSLPPRPYFNNFGTPSHLGGKGSHAPPSRRGGTHGNRFVCQSGRSRGGGGGADRTSASTSVKNPNWYVGYYDPSSNENPWAKLEAKMGLSATGDWTIREAGTGSGMVTTAALASISMGGHVEED